MATASQEKRILILGDGNFSFSLALARSLDGTDPSEALKLLGLEPREKLSILSTSFDSEEQLLVKYPEFKDIQSALRRFPFLKMAHGVNAWELPLTFGNGRKFHTILWNHPHLGTEDFRLHRFLMSHFLDSARGVLDPLESRARILVSLVQGQETRWNLLQEASKQGLSLLQVERLRQEAWPGWIVKRNKTGKSFKNLATRRHMRCAMPSFVFWFGLAVDEKKTLDLSSSLELNLNDLSLETPPKELPPPAETRMIPRPAALAPTLLPCPHCSKELTSQRAYKQHVHMVHTLQKFGPDWSPNAPRKLACKDCPKTFATQEALDQHAISKHSVLTASALEQSLGLRARQGLSSTIKPRDPNANDEEEEDAYVPCAVCGQAVIDRPYGLELHLESLKPAMGLDMSCSLCPKTFTEFRALVQHFKFCQSRAHRSVPETE